MKVFAMIHSYDFKFDCYVFSKQYLAHAAKCDLLDRHYEGDEELMDNKGCDLQVIECEMNPDVRL